MQLNYECPRCSCKIPDDDTYACTPEVIRCPNCGFEAEERFFNTEHYDHSWIEWVI